MSRKEISSRKWRVLQRVEKTAIPFSRAYSKAISLKILELLDQEIPSPLSEVGLLFVKDSTINALNLEYRKIDKPTDILSFQQYSEAELKNNKKLTGRSLGDIVISVDTLKRQAKEFNVSIEEELTRLLVHGILHLLGYDHEKVSQAKAAKMRRKERQLRRRMIELY